MTDSAKARCDVKHKVRRFDNLGGILPQALLLMPSISCPVIDISENLAVRERRKRLAKQWRARIPAEIRSRPDASVGSDVDGENFPLTSGNTLP
jgi:hypothetical protein